MLDSPNIKLVRPLKWEEVFTFWFLSEGTRQNWIDHAKERGYASWADWRLSGYAVPFGCAQAEWSLYEITEPGKAVSEFYGGPFRTWIERHYGGAKEMKFSELAKHMDIYDHPGVKSMMEDFPADKFITCLEAGGKIYAIEGSHRCCALAVMEQQGKKTPDKLYFAIGKSPLRELPIVGKNTSA